MPSVLPGSAAPPPVVLPIPSERVLTEGEIVIRNDLFTMLDGFAHDVGPRGHTAVARDVLHALGGFRSRIGEEAWLASGVPLAREHAIFGILQEDPITSHSFTRPRGYPGDAGLLDLMYGHEAVSARVASASEIGRAINAYTVNADMCESVRLRRGILAGAIDDAAARRPGASVLV
ncbi:methyltransferase type 12, partial [Methylobacterium hispanicum]